MPLCLCLLTALVIRDYLVHPTLDDRFVALLTKSATYRGVVVEPPKLTERGANFITEIRSRELPATRVILHLETHALSTGLEPGTEIRFTTRLKRPTWYKNPGSLIQASFNYRKFLERQGILLTGYLENPPEILNTIQPSSIGRLRRWVGLQVRQHVSFPASAVLASLITGEIPAIPQDLLEDFRRTGTMHLLAISGQNVAMVALFFYFPVLWLLKRSYRLMLTVSVRSCATLATLIPVGIYILVAGSPVSAVRAGIVALVMALALVARRSFDLLSALSLAAILICALTPGALFSASFQLSFAAILAIGWVAPWLIQVFTGWGLPESGLPRWLGLLLAETLAATLGTAPLLWYHFGQIPLTGLLTNLWAVPLMTVLLGGVLLGVWLAPWTGGVLWVVGKLMELFLWGIRLSAKFALVASFTLPTWPNHHLRVHFLDVGQGDACLIQTPHGHTILIDAGGFLIPGKPRSFDVGEEVVVPYLQRVGVKKIDRLILSHPHPDHFGGMTAVVRHFPVGEFWGNGDEFPDESYRALLQELTDHAVPILEKRASLTQAGLNQASLGETIDGVTLEVLSPGSRLARDINNNSLVLRVSLGQRHFLFTGDLERYGEERLLQSDVMRGRLQADVIKIPHHASRTSSFIGFIDTVAPHYAVASLGEDNLFGFPSPGVLEKYQRRGVTVFRTDQNGAIIFETDGNQLTAHPFIYLPGSPN